jgi:ubiquitin-protein ligase
MNVTKRIMQEISSFHKRGITNAFINYDETDIRNIKVLIIGSENTPYKYGYFLFNFYYPDTYPLVPLEVKFLTTSSGRVRFNPNLYANGKVCLSVLNTWGSKDWTPANDISSIILSIQSLVLHDKPITNEPGFYNAKDDIFIESFNKAIEYYKFKVAIIENLNDINFPFKDIIEEHFLRNKNEILKLCHANKDVVSLSFGGQYISNNVTFNNTNNTNGMYSNIYTMQTDYKSIINSIEKLYTSLETKFYKKTKEEEQEQEEEEEEEYTTKCGICLKLTDNLVDDTLIKCINCSFYSCSKCINEWCSKINNDCCPQCKKQFFVKYENKTKVHRPIKKEPKLEEPLVLKTTQSAYKSYVHKKGSNKYKTLEEFQGILNEPIDDLIYEQLDSNVENYKYKIFNVETGIWVQLFAYNALTGISSRILKKHPQKIIYHAKFPNKIYNKQTGHWVNTTGPTGKKLLKDATNNATVNAADNE